MEYYAKKEQETGQFNALVFLINKYKEISVEIWYICFSVSFCYKKGENYLYYLGWNLQEIFAKANEVVITEDINFIQTQQKKEKYTKNNII